MLIINELLSNNDIIPALKTSIHNFQRKTGFILFAAITTQPDIIFVVSRLARFNINPSVSHHQAADQMIQYLYNIKERALRYEDDENGARLFICTSNTLFADNILDRKSSQGYIMLLFGGPIT